MLALYNADNRTIGVILDEFFSAKVVRAVHGRNQLQEVLVDFWFNHFNVFVNDGFDRYSISSYERDAIRPHVLGRFRDLLGAASLHPAMLYYLDNYLNTVPRAAGRPRRSGGINENQGRELLELHTVGVDAGYTQTDVIEASRCLTGHGIDNLGTTGNYLLPRRPTTTTARKQVFGLAVPAGGGEGDVQRLLDHLACHPATARFIAKQAGAALRGRRPAGRRSSRGWPTSSCARTATCARSRRPSSAAPSSGPRPSATRQAQDRLRVRRRARCGRRARRCRTRASCAPRSRTWACRSTPATRPTGYSNRGADWLNPSAQLYRMNFAPRPRRGGGRRASRPTSAASIRSGGGDPDNPRSAAEAINRVVFGRTLSARVARRGADASPPRAACRCAVRVAGPALREPRDAGEVRP